MQLNRALFFLCLVIAVGAQRNHSVTCYLDVLTHRTRQGPCTHIIVPSAWTDDGFNLRSLLEDDYDTLGKMKERNPALKILLGLEITALRLELMSTNESGVENFNHALLRYLKEKRFDGLDLILMNGIIYDISSESTQLLTNLLKTLRGAFEGETRSSDEHLILSVFLSDRSDHSSAVEYNMRKLSQYLDFISILPARLEKDGSYINETIQHWQDQQVDLQKLNLAVPAFMRRSHTRHHHKHHPSTNTKENMKYHIHGVGLNMANQVCQAIKSGEQFITLTRLSDEQSLFEEVSWLLQKGFGGVGVVFIDMDVFCNSLCDNMTQDERATVESKLIVHSHHGHGNHHHRHEHFHNHRDHHQHLHFLHGRQNMGDRHQKYRHHHRHGRHGHQERGHHHHHHHHLHYPRPAP